MVRLCVHLIIDEGRFNKAAKYERLYTSSELFRYIEKDTMRVFFSFENELSFYVNIPDEKVEGMVDKVRFGDCVKFYMNSHQTLAIALNEKRLFKFKVYAEKGSNLLQLFPCFEEAQALDLTVSSDLFADSIECLLTHDKYTSEL